MNESAFSQLLTLYTWFLLAAFLMIMLLIARFYERFSKERTFFQAFIVVAMLFGANAVRQTRLQLMDNSFGTLLSATAGFLLFALCAFLYRRMTVGRDQPQP